MTEFEKYMNEALELIEKDAEMMKRCNEQLKCFLKSYEGMPLPITWRYDGKPIAKIVKIDTENMSMIIQPIEYCEEVSE